MARWGMRSILQVNQPFPGFLVLYLQYLGHPPTKDMAVVDKTPMGSWDVHRGYGCVTHVHK